MGFRDIMLIIHVWSADRNPPHVTGRSVNEYAGLLDSGLRRKDENVNNVGGQYTYGVGWVIAAFGATLPRLRRG